MSIDLWFEADERLTEEGLVSLLLEAGGAQFELENGPVGFSFASGMSAHPLGPEGATHIKAEDPRGASFRVGSRCVFRPNSEQYDASLEELQKVLLRVEGKKGAYFVVSFQLESTLFINVGKGVERCS